MIWGDQWECACGWQNLFLRKSCRHCSRSRPAGAVLRSPIPELQDANLHVEAARRELDRLREFNRAKEDVLWTLALLNILIEPKEDPMEQQEILQNVAALAAAIRNENDAEGQKAALKAGTKLLASLLIDLNRLAAAGEKIAAISMSATTGPRGGGGGVEPFTRTSTPVGDEDQP
jgi:hypothetical protein